MRMTARRRIGAALVSAGFLIYAAMLMAAHAGAENLPVAHDCFAWSSAPNNNLTRPPMVVFDCTSGQSGIVIKNWKYWGPYAAYGTGETWEDNCLPDCATGKEIRQPATLFLYDVKLHDGRPYYSAMNIKSKGQDGTMQWKSTSGFPGSSPYWN